MIIWEKLKIISKNPPNDLEKVHPNFSEEGKEERPAEHVGVFCKNIGITTHTLELYTYNG